MTRAAVHYCFSQDTKGQLSPCTKAIEVFYFFEHSSGLDPKRIFPYPTSIPSSSFLRLKLHDDAEKRYFDITHHNPNRR